MSGERDRQIWLEGERLCVSGKKESEGRFGGEKENKREGGTHTHSRIWSEIGDKKGGLGGRGAKIWRHYR